MVLNEGGDDHPERPRGFPVCQSYFKDEDLNPVYVKEKEAEEEGSMVIFELDFLLIPFNLYEKKQTEIG